MAVGLGQSRPVFCSFPGLREWERVEYEHLAPRAYWVTSEWGSALLPMTKHCKESLDRAWVACEPPQLSWMGREEKLGCRAVKEMLGVVAHTCNSCTLGS